MININYNKKMMLVLFLMLEIEVERSQKFEYPKIIERCHKFCYRSSYTTKYSYYYVYFSSLQFMKVSLKSKVYIWWLNCTYKNFLNLIVHHYQQITSVISYQIHLQILEYLQWLRRLKYHTSLWFKTVWFELSSFF